MNNYEYNRGLATVLYEIAHGTPKAQRLAQEALKALDVDFDKYYS